MKFGYKVMIFLYYEWTRNNVQCFEIDPVKKLGFSVELILLHTKCLMVVLKEVKKNHILGKRKGEN